MDDRELQIKKRKIKISHVIILLFLIAAGVFAYFRLSLINELNKKKEAIREAGYPVNIEELDKWYSIPNDAVNSAYSVLDAFRYYKEAPDNEALPMFGKAILPGRTESMSEEMLNVISQHIEDNSECLDLLHRVDSAGYGRYPIDLALGMDTLLPHLSEIRKCVFLLTLEAVSYAEKNDPNRATDCIKSILNVSNTLSQEPVMVSLLVRLACLEKAVSTLEYSMNKVAFSDEQLIELGRIFEKPQNISYFKSVLIGERCVGISVFENPFSCPRDLFDNIPPDIVLELYVALGILDKEASVYLDFQEEYLKAYELPYHEQINAFKAIDTKIVNIPNIYVFSEYFFSGNITRLITLNNTNIAKLRIANIALAIERYRLANKKLPDSLDNLVPDFLESVPLDTFDAQKMRYKKLDAGYVVYSVGEDLKDDGGLEQINAKKQNGNSTFDLTFIIEK